MDAEGLGRKLLLIPSGDPAAPPRHFVAQNGRVGVASPEFDECFGIDLGQACSGGEELFTSLDCC